MLHLVDLQRPLQPPLQLPLVLLVSYSTVLDLIVKVLKEGVPAIRFKPSPFIRVERSVSSVVECPGMCSLFLMDNMRD